MSSDARATQIQKELESLYSQVELCIKDCCQCQVSIDRIINSLLLSDGDSYSPERAAEMRREREVENWLGR